MTAQSGSHTMAGLRTKMESIIGRWVTAAPVLCVALTAGTLVSCGHGSSSTAAAVANYTIGGTVSGLTGTLVLQDNGGDSLTVSASGAFSFPTALAAGSTYAVTALTQPVGQVCMLADGSGTAVATVASVAVTCVATNGLTYTIGGAVSGLASGAALVLQDNGGDNLTVSASGGFTFATAILDGTTYAVSVLAQPTGQFCSVAQGAASVAEAAVTAVAVTCADIDSIYTVGGSINGLSGTGLTLTLNVVGGASQTLQPAGGDTTFAFPNGFTAPTSGNGTGYSVSITTQPAGPTETCIATNAQGFVHSFVNVTGVQITCVNNTTSPLQGAYQLSINGAAQTAWLTLYPDGTFLFADINNNASCNNATSSYNGNGVEYGSYNWNSATNAFTFLNVLVDTDGSCGLSDPAVTGVTRTLSKTGSGQSAVLSFTSSDRAGTTLTFNPVSSTSGDVNGAYLVSGGNQQTVAIFGTDGRYGIFESQTDAFSNRLAGVEYGCYTAVAGTLDWNTTCTGAARTGGSGGIAGGLGKFGSLMYTLLTPDQIQVGSGATATTYTRLFAN
jgi:hypothetical protein